MGDKNKPMLHECWAHFRFSVVGGLLAAPPARGELDAELAKLSEKMWRHPVTEEPARFGFSTIERWYYEARNAGADPVGALRKKLRKDIGQQPSMPDVLRQVLRGQHDSHRSWSYQLHYDNLRARVKADPGLGPLPSYGTVRRYMKTTGLLKRRRLSSRDTEAARKAEQRLDEREVRSYEAEYVNGLWHWDGHSGSRKVLTAAGELETPILIGVLDDRSRVGCHLQWYLGEERGEIIAHCLQQAFQKRGLPRAGMSDGGPAMMADEVRRGLARLSILHEKTLAYSPYQNGKQENFWAQVEGRLLAMLEGEKELTLSLLNEATQAWLELEYNREIHSEIGESPVARFLAGPDVTRPCPSSDELRLAFMAEEGRTQRRSDGTISIEGHRFEVPSRYRHLERVRIRYARWDLSQVYLVDERTSAVLCRLLPLDKTKNSSGIRRSLEPIGDTVSPPNQEGGIAPLLKQLMADYAATGLPPAYLPKEEHTPTTHEDET